MEKRAVFVSGASSGLGRAVAEHLAGEGYAVYAGARSFKKEGELLPSGVFGVFLDVCDEVSVKFAVDTVLSKEGEIFALINCAAFFTLGSCEEVEVSELAKIIDTNFLGMVRMTRAVLPSMRECGRGRIINFSSINGLLSIPFQGAYSASKHAVEGWSESLAQEVSRFGIDVTAVEPGDCRGGAQKYRKVCEKTSSENSPYFAFFTAGTAKIHFDESHGLPQERVAKAVSKLLRQKKPPHSKVVASLLQRSSVWLHKALPRRAFNRIIAGYYSPKKGSGN
ncbi:MAG: SDR family oxidoreductase [Eubacteriales bacterium]